MQRIFSKDKKQQPTFHKVVPVGSDERVVRVAVVGQCVGVTLVNVALLGSFRSGRDSSFGGFLAGVLLFIHRFGECHFDAGPFDLRAVQVVHGQHGIVSGREVDESVVADFLDALHAPVVPLAEDLPNGKRKRKTVWYQ